MPDPNPSASNFGSWHVPDLVPLVFHNPLAGFPPAHKITQISQLTWQTFVTHFDSPPPLPLF